MPFISYMNNIDMFTEYEWDLLIFYLFESVRGQSMGNLILVIKWSAVIFNLGE